MRSNVTDYTALRDTSRNVFVLLEELAPSFLMRGHRNKLDYHIVSILIAEELLRTNYIIIVPRKIDDTEMCVYIVPTVMFSKTVLVRILYSRSRTEIAEKDIQIL